MPAPKEQPNESAVNPQGPPVNPEAEWRVAKQAMANLMQAIAKTGGFALSFEVTQVQFTNVERFLEKHKPESMRKKPAPTKTPTPAKRKRPSKGK